MKVRKNANEEEKNKGTFEVKRKEVKKADGKREKDEGQ
jgi:hypothetical protein